MGKAKKICSLLIMALASIGSAKAEGQEVPVVGQAWKGWQEGELQLHFIYTGSGESIFMIFPDSTTMLVDCGDFDAAARGKLSVSLLPDTTRHAGEWIARYVERVNPRGNDVDYMMVSHYHSDHTGTDKFYTQKEVRDSADYYLSGFSLAGEQLHFHKAFDRGWPQNDDPMPLQERYSDGLKHIGDFYNYMTRHRGLQVEKFREGAVDQINLRHNAAKYPDFKTRNICANGRIADAQGRVRDLYGERLRENPDNYNENGMSLGFILTYGRFKFFTAGDFSDHWTQADGSEFYIEDALAEVVEPVNVAKLTHHGHYSMPESLVTALGPQVWVNCVWDQLHTVRPVMERLADTALYPGERIVCPTIFPEERRQEDDGQPWLDIIPAPAFEGGHVVVNVPPDGESFTVSYITAGNESMTVKSVQNFPLK